LRRKKKKKRKAPDRQIKNSRERNEGPDRHEGLKKEEGALNSPEEGKEGVGLKKRGRGGGVCSDGPCM